MLRLQSNNHSTERSSSGSYAQVVPVRMVRCRCRPTELSTVLMRSMAVAMALVAATRALSRLEPVARCVRRVRSGDQLVDEDVVLRLERLPTSGIGPVFGLRDLGVQILEATAVRFAALWHRELALLIVAPLCLLRR